jgi:ketosteroid isomerase-like protein
MKTTDELVRELADREAIRDLPVRYCDCLWRNDIDGLVSLFTEDGAFAVRCDELEAVSRGRAELKEMYESVADEIYPRPYIHNHVVELRGPDSAIGRCYLEVRSEKHDMDWIGAGYYEDRYSKIGDEWKFALRHHVRIGPKIALRTFIR